LIAINKAEKDSPLRSRKIILLSSIVTSDEEENSPPQFPLLNHCKEEDVKWMPRLMPRLSLMA
jgi:hypothetical protein